jgi:hypothetical protein
LKNDEGGRPPHRQRDERVSAAVCGDKNARSEPEQEAHTPAEKTQLFNSSCVFVPSLSWQQIFGFFSTIF